MTDSDPWECSSDSEYCVISKPCSWCGHDVSDPIETHEGDKLCGECETKYVSSEGYRWRLEDKVSKLERENESLKELLSKAQNDLHVTLQTCKEYETKEKFDAWGEKQHQFIVDESDDEELTAEQIKEGSKMRQEYRERYRARPHVIEMKNKKTGY